MKGDSYFNEYQQDYMRELARMPAEAKCICGVVSAWEVLASALQRRRTDARASLFRGSRSNRR